MTAVSKCTGGLGLPCGCSQCAAPLTAEQKRGLRYEIPPQNLLSHVQYDAAQIDKVLVPRQFRDAPVEPSVVDEGAESVLQEAQRLTHGPRQADYGHPLDDYTRTAALISALFAHKLKEPLTAEEASLIQCCVKMSRHINAPKRDNMTDLAGYAWVTWACTEERKRRSDFPVSKKEPTAI